MDGTIYPGHFFYLMLALPGDSYTSLRIDVCTIFKKLRAQCALKLRLWLSYGCLPLVTFSLPHLPLEHEHDETTVVYSGSSEDPS